MDSKLSLFDKQAALEAVLLRHYLVHFTDLCKVAGLSDWAIPAARWVGQKAVGPTAQAVGATAASNIPLVAGYGLQASATNDVVNNNRVITPAANRKFQIGEGMIQGNNASSLNYAGNLLTSNRWVPKSIKTPSMGWGLRAGAGSVAANVVNEAIPGADPPVAGDQYTTESWWKPQVRSLRNIATNAVGAGAAGGPVAPFAAAGGAAVGALREPLHIIDLLRKQKGVNAATQANTTASALDYVRRHPDMSDNPVIRKFIPSGQQPLLQRAANAGTMRYVLPAAGAILGAGALGLGLRHWRHRHDTEPA